MRFMLTITEYQIHIWLKCFKIFFQHLKRLTRSCVFHCNSHKPNKKLVVYLPFTPHMFVKVHVFKMNEEYDISYLTHHELFDYRHKLYSASEDIEYVTFWNIFDLAMRNQTRYCCTYKSTIIQVEQGQSMTQRKE